MRFLNPASCTFFALVIFSSPVFAGFEFVPPPKKEVISSPMPEVSETPETMDYSGINVEVVEPVPVAPVVSAPLPIAAPLQPVPPPAMPQEMPTKSMAPMIQPTISMNAPQNIVPMDQMIAKPVRTKTSGLFIDPYPLRQKETASVSSNKIEQALAEKAGGMHPVQLGGGMTTGANSKGEHIKSTARKAKTKSLDSIELSSLTPMMGDEPAPLPGYGADVVERQGTRQYAQAVGFGKDLPIALAISQVVPSEYTHRFDGDIDASLKVDWDGGKPWNLVLNDMLREHNMRAEIQGNIVVIKELEMV